LSPAWEAAGQPTAATPLLTPTAASVLERAGQTAVAVLAGGPLDWSDATGVALESNA
jgi:hypothetical protein